MGVVKFVDQLTFDWMSSSPPKQCRQKRNAVALCLKPPRDALAGLSAETMEIVPRKNRVFPSILKGTPVG